MEELEAEGGITARHERYAANEKLLRKKLSALGFVPFLEQEVQGPIITTFYYPAGYNFSFQEMYDYIKERGYFISGKNNKSRDVPSRKYWRNLSGRY